MFGSQGNQKISPQSQTEHVGTETGVPEQRRIDSTCYKSLMPKITKRWLLFK